MKKIQHRYENVNIFRIHELQSQIHSTIFAQNVIIDAIDTKKSNMKLKRQNKKNILKI